MTDDQTVRLFHLPFSFMLPQRVASERGYFAEEGLDVELVERDRADVDWKYIPAEERLTEDYDVDLYPICKWESIKRTWEMRDGRIVAKGTFADQPYAVFTTRDDIESGADLANVPVGINKRTGQEYTAIRALEQHVDPDEVVVEHHGMPTDRLRALRDGEVDAVSLLEPHSSLAEQLGFTRVFEFENHMGMVGAAELDHETLVRFRRAYAKAVRDINADPEAFRDDYLAMLEADEEVAPDLFEDVDMEALRDSISVPAYETPELAGRSELEAHLEWMKTRDLIDNQADIDQIIATGR